ncbi:phage baseplate assembly protein V [Thalassococcus sp. BH17M4-6]|uniref:phage baseplate assembly protein V n=1 Tax=Thalassococcus sp. BH17M4-6 TaxID=3413148 RepID=UPI003BBE750B
MTSRVQGFVLGTVKDLEDPEAIGRIKVAYQGRPGEPLSNWAFMVRPMASTEVGMWFMPELEDQVVVGFLNGNIEQPYVMGSIFTKEKAPPVTEPGQRVIRSVQGHEIILDDTDAAENVIIRDASDNEIKMTQDGIEITSAGKITIQGTEIAINGDSSVDIETSGQLTGKGSPIHLNP